MTEEWTPSDNDKKWLSTIFNLLAENGTWVAPVSGQAFIKKGKSLVWCNEDIGDEHNIFKRSKIIGELIGINVTTKGEL